MYSVLLVERAVVSVMRICLILAAKVSCDTHRQQVDDAVASAK
jgi:hypothetical protein